MPTAESPPQCGQAAAGPAGWGVGHGEAEHPAIGQRGVSEPLAAPHDSQLSPTDTGGVTIRQEFRAIQEYWHTQSPRCRRMDHPGESVNALYKKDVITQEVSWNDTTEVMLATAQWVSWHSNEKLHSWCGDLPPMEFEEAFWQDRPAQPPAAA